MINAVELKRIAEFLGVKMEELTKVREDSVDTDIVHAFMGKVESDEAKEALNIADKLSDMILFHSRVRDNGMAMMIPWEAFWDILFLKACFISKRSNLKK